MEACVGSFIMLHDVVTVINSEWKRKTSTMVTEPISNGVEDIIADVIQISYELVKEWMKRLIFHSVDEAPIFGLQQGYLDKILVRNVDI